MNNPFDYYASQVPDPITRMSNGDIDPDQFMLDEYTYSRYQLDLQNNYANSTFSPAELAALELPERMPAVDVAARIRIPMKSNVMDRIDLSMTPYLIDPISLIGDESVQWIYVIAPTQSGKTVILQVAVADTIDQNPGTLLYIYPDENNGKAAMEEKLIGMIRETPFLYKHVVMPEKINLSTKKIRLDNMTIWPAWSGSLGTLSSKPAKIIILDEIRLMKLSIGKESNAIKLASDRVTTFEAFGQAQAIGVTTPSVKGDLMYQQTLIPGIQILHRMLKCQSCDRYWRPVFHKHMRRDKGSGKFAPILLCPYCHNKQEEGKHKRDLNKGSGYGIPKIHKGLKELPPLAHLKKKKMLFWFESISSPFRSLERICIEYEETFGKIEDYKNFFQCWCAEFWEDDISKLSEKKLKDRIQIGFMKGTVPKGTKFLTGGVDVQDVGFYVTILAHGADRKTDLVDQYLVECHKDTSNWQKTKDILEVKINTRKWDGWMLAAWTIDVADGDRYHEVMDATSEMNRCFRIRGTNSIKQVTNIKYNKELDHYQVKAYPYLEETDTLCISENFTLPEDVEQDFLTQFPNARKIREEHPKTGESIITWKKTGQNDYRMSTVYAMESLDFTLEEGGYNLRDMKGREDYKNNPAILIRIDGDESTNPDATRPGGKSNETDDDWEESEEDDTTNYWQDI